MRATIDPHDSEICLGSHADLADQGGAMLPPIAQTSLFAFSSFQALIDGLDTEHRHHVYSRGQNPTVEVLERQLAELEHGEACKAFASGMGAISAVLLGLLEAGDHVVFVNHVYGPTLELADHLRRFGVEHSRVIDGDPESVEASLRPETKLLWMESPGTMLFRTLDLAALVDLARSREILTCVDNSWATPLFQKPLRLGVDLVVHACSKYIGGHSDVIAGALVGPDALIEQVFYRSYLLNGAALGPMDAWLIIRGLRTLPVRMRQHHDGGLAVARYLAEHSAVARVFHPGLDDPAVGELTGCSGLFSFELRSDRFDDLRNLIDSLRLFRIGVSWGGPESLVISPSRADNAEALRQQGVPPGLVRLSVGLEDPDALIEDLEGALGRL